MGDGKFVCRVEKVVEVRIYFAGGETAKERMRMLWVVRAHRLFSFFSIIDPNCGYDTKDRFEDFVELLGEADVDQ